MPSNPFDKMRKLREQALESLKPEPSQEKQEEVQVDKNATAKEPEGKK